MVFKCEICGEISDTRNFGAKACRSCAAFFRRAVKWRKQHRCKALRSCVSESFEDVLKKPTCKSCRLRKCLHVGMQLTDVIHTDISHVSAVSDKDSLLEAATNLRNSLFLRRVKRFADYSHFPVRFGRATRLSADKSTWIEQQVLREYFAQFYQMQQFLRSDVTMYFLATHFYCVWGLFEITLVAMQNHGHRHRLMWLTDETFFPVTTETFIAEYSVRSAGSPFGFSLNDVISRLAEDAYMAIFEYAERLQQKHLDTVELAAFSLLLLAKYSGEMFLSDHIRKTFVDRVMRDLHAYYSNSSDKCMTLFDRITSLMLEFHGIFHQFNEMAVLIDMEVPPEPQGELMAPLQSYRLRTQGTQPYRHRSITQSNELL